MNFRLFWAKYRRPILRGVQITATVAIPVVTAYAIPKVQQKIYKLKKDGKDGKLDQIKACLPELAMIAGTTALSVGTGIAAESVASSEIATSNAIAAAERASKKAVHDALIAEVPEKKLEEVTKKVALADSKATENITTPKHATKGIVVDTGHGDQEFDGIWSSQIFRSHWNFIQSVVNECNSIINNGYDVTLNQFLIKLGLDTVECGDAYYFPNGIMLQLVWITNERGEPRGHLTYAEDMEPKQARRPLATI